jgi:hypothetical protein
MTSRISYSLLFMLIKINVQKEISFSHTKPRAFFFSSPPLWKPIKTKGHLMTYFHRRPHCQTQEQIISFSRKNNQVVARFQKQIVLNSHRNNFCFQNARSRFMLDPYSFIKLKRREIREWLLKTIICLSHWQSTLGGNDQYKGQHCA